jgi:hypothetical protein
MIELPNTPLPYVTTLAFAIGDPSGLASNRRDGWPHYIICFICAKIL